MADSETCGEGNDSNYYGANPTSTSGTAKSRCAAAFSVSNGYKYYINIPGVYCFTVKGGDGNVGKSGDNGCSGATVKGCYKLQRGDVVTFRVGSKGATRPKDTTSDYCQGDYGGGGGGGASWVYLTRSGSNKLLLVAGGGGGGGYDTTSGWLCGGGSSSTSANNAATSGDEGCGDDSASDGASVTLSNFADDTTTGAGGDGGFHWNKDKSCGKYYCAKQFACGGGGGGYVGGSKGNKDSDFSSYNGAGGGGGGSYVNIDSTYFDSGNSMSAGSTGITSPSGGSITVAKPTSNATCSTTNCQWSSSYSACN